MIVDNKVPKVLHLIREQKKYCIRTADGKTIVTNHILYNSLEQQLFFEQKKIGRENKKLLGNLYKRNKL